MIVMMLAAGTGGRMGHLVENCPKPLVKLAGKPIMQYSLERLAKQQLNEVVINLYYRGEQIEQYFGDGSAWGLHIRYTHEAELLDTGGGIKHALPLLGDKPFMVVNGDVWTDYAFANLVGKLQDDCLAHLVLVPTPAHKRQDDFGFDADGRLVKCSENGYTFSGIGVYRPELISSVTEEKFSLVKPLLQAMSNGQVTGEVHHGLWSDIGTAERLSQVEDIILANS